MVKKVKLAIEGKCPFSLRECKSREDCPADKVLVVDDLKRWAAQKEKAASNCVSGGGSSLTISGWQKGYKTIIVKD